MMKREKAKDCATKSPMKPFEPPRLEKLGKLTRAIQASGKINLKMGRKD